ncbi:hypothetical protein OCU04_009476 [Sclerotinia nivalis]|uniref:Uncharacterized protein n=1 Tax=Sclerotinia nivalis TaxID=352851 RepID=A0A9X0AFA8_9HELO|nr:hypothetical protein OCU04_009476 [Sclerotinia nivalis]
MNQTTNKSPTKVNMSQNYVVFECGHKEVEIPTKLKTLKRAFSIKRALSNKIQESKDIPVEGACEECRRDPFGFLSGGGAPSDKREPPRVVNRGEDDPPRLVDKTETEYQRVKFFTEAGAAYERDRKAREVDYGVQSPSPSHIPRPAGILVAQDHPDFAHLNRGENPFADEKAETFEAKVDGRLEELQQVERHIKEAWEEDDPDPQK